jgi:phage tail sheath gpL-like
MAEAALRVDKRTPLWGLSYTEPTGTPASNTIVFAGGPATSGGTVDVMIAGRVLRVGVQSGDAVTEIGEAVEGAINAATNLPVTANNVAGTVTLTARLDGPEGNSIRYRATISATGVTCTNTGAALASGATAGDPASALTAIEAERFDIIALGSDDSTAAGKVDDHQVARSNPLEQLWGEALTGSTGTDSTVNAIATALDSYRSQVVWGAAVEQPVFELVAAMAAARAATDPRQSLDDYVLPGITPRYDESAWPNAAEIEAALDNGVTPLRANRNGTVSVVRSIHSRVTTPRYIDTNETQISDYVDEDLVTQLRARFAGKALKAEGTPGTSYAVSSKDGKKLLHERMRLWDAQDYVQGTEAIIKDGRTQVEPNAVEVNRLDFAFPFKPVRMAHAFAVKKIFEDASTHTITI